MNNKKALTLYLVGALGQIIVVCIIAFVLRRYGLEVGYATPLGWIIIAIGGISSALWGAIISIKYRNTGFKTVICDFFRIKQSPLNYGWMILFLCLDFLPVVFGGRISIRVWYLPIIMFFKHIVLGGIEEIGWRYLFQPLLQERLHYILATIITFFSWGLWHFLFFYLDETHADVIPFSLGLLVNSFILSALYVKTNNLWICVMTHSLINVFSQLVTGGNQYVGYFSKVVIIVIAIMLATKTIRKQVNNCANANT